MQFLCLMYVSATLEGESSKLGTSMLGFRKEGQNSKYVLQIYVSNNLKHRHTTLLCGNLACDTNPSLKRFVDFTMVFVCYKESSQRIRKER